MLASPKTRLTKKSYFVVENTDLYYVVDILPDESQYLIEDCKTLKQTWISVVDCEMAAKEVKC